MRFHLRPSELDVRRKYILYIMLIVLACVGVELFLFNYRFWESLTFEAEHYPNAQIMQGDDGACTLELTGIDEVVYNLHIRPFDSSSSFSKGDTVPITIFATDEGRSDYYQLPSTEVVYGVPESEYVRLHLSGKSERLKIEFKSANVGDLSQESVSINSLRPLYVRPWRILLTALLCVLILAFRPTSELYKRELNLGIVWQKVALVLTVLIVCGSFYVIGRVFYNKSNEGSTTHLQYAYLAEALLDGHPWLEIDPPAQLESANNPYDPSERARIFSDSDNPPVMDYAYYQGRYYSYFGVVPAIMFYVPYALCTGKYLPTGPLVIALCVMLVPCVFWLLYECIRRHVPHVSIGLYLLLSTILVVVTGATYALRMSILYSVPIVCSLVFSCIGLSCWLRSCTWQGDKINKVWLVAGSIFLALTMGCRPQFALLAFTAFPIFWQQIRMGAFFTRRGVANTACVLGPYTMIGIGLMYYNVIRFGSLLDFGATYNLTGFDMTHRGFDPERFLIGYWEYLFQPLRFGLRFPYMETVAQHFNMSTDYQGLVVNEPFLGGFFPLNPLGICIFGLWSVRNRLKASGLLGFAVVLVLFSLIMIGCDVQMVGMTQRYHMDFSLFLMLPAIMVVITVLQNSSYNSVERVVLGIVVALSVLCIVVQLFAIIADGRYAPLEDANPSVFYMVKYQLFSMLSIR